MDTAKSIKKTKIIFWISTLAFVLFDSGGAFFFNTPYSREVMRGFGYPDYFGTTLAIGKIIGGIILAIPLFPSWLKEWAYVGFGISLICAIITVAIKMGIAGTFMPVIALAVLAVSYFSFHKLRKEGAITN